MPSFWQSCLQHFEQELPPQQFSTWIKPLQLEGENAPEQGLTLIASNGFVLKWIRDKYLNKITKLAQLYFNTDVSVDLIIGKSVPKPKSTEEKKSVDDFTPVVKKPNSDTLEPYRKTRLQSEFSFDNLVVGRANDLARAAAMQVAENPGGAYNPLFIYGGTGLGKTHLMLAIGNHIHQNQPKKSIRYVHAEDFYSEMVKAYRQQTIEQFKQYYRSLDVLLVDDIQFFINKERSQEQFFYAFNALSEAKKQIVITCDTYPKNISGLDERLITRFDWGLTVQVEPPETEMRVAILKKKAESEGIQLDDEVAFFIAKHLRSNVRELEGALKKVMAYSLFHGKKINLDVTKDALKDMIGLSRNITVEVIQKTVADFYKIKVADMFSKKRTRLLARPRQIAMWLCKELTQRSYPMIGDAFGGRDHTTVMHAVKTIDELRKKDNELNHDLHVLLQVLKG
ncbi:MAG: chromosomal replication initiator protein DnaA [Pseudomonadota bacterium]|jgi:chromosomal replication initiator protein